MAKKKKQVKLETLVTEDLKNRFKEKSSKRGVTPTAQLRMLIIEFTEDDS